MPLNFLDGCTPADFGVDPNRYPTFRTDPLNGNPVQLEAIEFLAYSESWVAAARLPTGIGKELVAWSVAKLTGMRAAILTSTKGLSDQYNGNMAEYGLVDVRGKSNYSCGHYANLNCRGGGSMGCPLTQGRGCEYEVAKDRAKRADILITNYSYWMTVNDKANGLERSGDDAEINGANPIELLILDEAHAAVDRLADYLGFKLTERDIQNYADPKSLGDNWEDWRKVALEGSQELKKEIRTTGMELAFMGTRATQAQVRVLHELEERLTKFERIAYAGDDWVLEAQIGTSMGRQWNFDVVWPGRYAAQYLFCGVRKVVEMSATLNRKDLGLQGLRADSYEFREWRRIFSSSNCPVYFNPPVKLNEEGKTVAIRITNKSSDADKQLWVNHMDSMIQSRLDRRIVVITSSYKYQQFIMENSRFGRFMMGNKGDAESGTAADNFEQFITLDPPIILCSPSFGTGWNFIGDRAEFLILSKVPLRVPGGASKVMAARLERDSEYGDNETMRDVAQICGRLQRSEQDTGEVVIADGTWSWFGFKNKHLAPGGFVNDVRNMVGKQLPLAPVRIKDRAPK